jgi:hypothetical protein
VGQGVLVEDGVGLALLGLALFRERIGGEEGEEGSGPEDTRQ